MDPRHQTIEKFFQVNDAEATGKLESSDCLNLEEADRAGMSGAAAGVGSKVRICDNNLTSNNFPD